MRARNHLQANRTLALEHVPLTFPEHSRCYSRSSMGSGGGEDHPDPARRPRTPRPPPFPGSHHAIDERQAALPTVPERRRTAGSGPAAAVPTPFGVSLSQHCPGWRGDPTWGPWPSSARSTGPATPSTPCSIRSSPSTWRPSCARWRRLATGRACRSLWSASSGTSCCAGCSRLAWRGFRARAAGASTGCRFRVKGGRGVRAVAAAG